MTDGHKSSENAFTSYAEDSSEGCRPVVSLAAHETPRSRHQRKGAIRRRQAEGMAPQRGIGQSANDAADEQPPQRRDASESETPPHAVERQRELVGESLGSPVPGAYGSIGRRPADGMAAPPRSIGQPVNKAVDEQPPQRRDRPDLETLPHAVERQQELVGESLGSSVPGTVATAENRQSEAKMGWLWKYLPIKIIAIQGASEATVTFGGSVESESKMPLLSRIHSKDACILLCTEHPTVVQSLEIAPVEVNNHDQTVRCEVCRICRCAVCQRACRFPRVTMCSRDIGHSACAIMASKCLPGCHKSARCVEYGGGGDDDDSDAATNGEEWYCGRQWVRNSGLEPFGWKYRILYCLCACVPSYRPPASLQMTACDPLCLGNRQVPGCLCRASRSRKNLNRRARNRAQRRKDRRPENRGSTTNATDTATAADVASDATATDATANDATDANTSNNTNSSVTAVATAVTEATAAAITKSSSGSNSGESSASTVAADDIAEEAAVQPKPSRSKNHKKAIAAENKSIIRPYLSQVPQ